MEKKSCKIGKVTLLTEKGVFSIKENMEIMCQNDGVKSPFIGYGLAGYIIASYLGGMYKSDVAFIREKPKQYGTCNQVDGKISDIYTLVVQEGREKEAIGVAAKHKIEIKKIVSFNTLEQKVILPKFHFCQSKIEGRYIGYDFKKHLKFLRSSEGFWLSSGKHMNSYVETLPAANTYKVIEKAVQKYCRVLSTYDIYIGLGYGGVFFSIVAAMLMNKKVVILDMKKEKDKLDINGNILFFDDFMSTGLNIEKACDIVNNNGKKSAILLYAKKNVETCIEYFVCDII